MPFRKSYCILCRPSRANPKFEDTKKKGLDTKSCVNCKNIKHVADFHKSGYYKDNAQRYKSQCIKCSNLTPNRVLNNPILIKKCKEYKLCSQCNLEKLTVDFRKVNNSKHHMCKNCEKLEYRDYRKDMIQNRPDAYEHYKKRMRNMNNYKRESDECYKIRCNLGTRMWHALTDTKKSTSTIELLGCTAELLWIHLESKFIVGMTRENYGRPKDKSRGWDMDHIVPCASFNLIDPEQQKLCFHYTNIQPMWSDENSSKGAKLDYVSCENSLQ